MTVNTPVYLDCHATTPCDPAVIAAMIPYFGAEKFGNANARTHVNGRSAAKALEQAKTEIAALINAAPETLTLTSGATEANILALATTLSPRTEILVSAIEHPSVFEAARKSGLSVKIIPANPDGFITPDALKSLIGDQTRLVAVMLANHEIGTIQPVAELAAIAHEAGALFHCDATQAVGKILVDVNVLGVDFLSFSAHKMYGPQGIGALYARSTSVQRSGTAPLALSVGMARACRIAADIMQGEAKRLQDISNYFLQTLQSGLPGVLVNGALSPRLPGSLNLRLPELNAEDILLDLADDLCLSTGAACTSKTRQPSPVLRAIGLTDFDIASSIRLSPGRMTTREDMAYAAEKVLNACLSQSGPCISQARK